MNFSHHEVKRVPFLSRHGGRLADEVSSGYAPCMSETAPQRPARLLDLHPLFRRLSGEVVWLMFEEHDADPEDIQAFMDDMHDLLRGTTKLIEASLSGERVRARIVAEGNRRPCEACARILGKTIALEREGAEKLLPPYALGCPLRAKIITTDHDAPDPDDLLQPDQAPHGELICGEWIFAHPWSKTST